MILLASEVILDMILGILSKYQESVLKIDMDGRVGGGGGVGVVIVPIMKFGFIDDHYSSKLFQVLVLYSVDIFSIAFFTERSGWRRGEGGGPIPTYPISLPLLLTATPLPTLPQLFDLIYYQTT